VRRFGGLAVLAAALAGLALAAVTLRAREDHYALPGINERLLYLRSGNVADRLCLDFDAIVADMYWIRTIQHYGRDYKNRTRTGRFELLYPLLDLTTTLDRHFLIAYRFGAIFLAARPPDGPGRADQAIALLEKGLQANPGKWQLAHDIAFTHYLYTGDYGAAADWFRRAAAMPGAPEWIGPLAAVTVAQGGNRAGARQMLKQLRTAQEAYIRTAAERILAQIDALDRVDELDALVSSYQARTGLYPRSWRDLVDARLLPGLPIDPSGVPYSYDAATHRAGIAPESHLQPLPPTLQPR